jgi:serine phosphatase RsbU (regulator of sigma subunit)
MVLAGKQTLLWLGEAAPPHNVRAAAGTDWSVEECSRDKPLRAQFKEAALVAFGPNGSADAPYWLEEVLSELDGTAAVGVFLVPQDARVMQALLSRRAGHFICVSQDAGVQELSAKFAAAGALQKGIESLREELAASREMYGPGFRGQEMEEEMRLAAKLQRDFLPKNLPAVGAVRFGVLYQPAGWVSGDLYDIMRLDETHVGFYIADVVGHGMPAALLTMFIKKALLTKRIEGRTYEIVPPASSLAALNLDIYEQNLSSCQFCTAVYCVVDTEKLTVDYSRAGHPQPIVLCADGSVEIGELPGGLLGIFPEEVFHSGQLKLDHGDRLFLYSDGAEYGLFGRSQCDDGQIKTAIASFAGVSREEMFAGVTARINASRAANGVQDDVTMVVMDVE